MKIKSINTRMTDDLTIKFSVHHVGEGKEHTTFEACYFSYMVWQVVDSRLTRKMPGFNK